MPEHLCDSIDEDCTGCGLEPGECTASERPCGHHCNCSWNYDICHWCGETWGR